MALGRTGSIHNALQLQRGHHILAFVISIFAVLIQLDGIKAGCNNDRTIIFCDDLILLGVINGTGLAELLTNTALTGLQLDTVQWINYGYIGDCLGKGGINRRTGIEPPVKLVKRLLGGAFFLADAATGTLVHIDITSLLANIHSEITNKAGNLFNLTICMDGNILMGGSFHHLGS